MKKLLFLSVLLCGLTGQAQTYDDTIGKYPFFYFYNFPCYYDTLHCNVVTRSLPHELNYLNREGDHAIFFHTDDTLFVTGLSIYVGYNNAIVLTLYDSNMVRMGDVSLGTYASAGDYLDSTNVHLLAPRWVNSGMFSDSVMPFQTRLWENKEVVKVIGDFYIGARQLYQLPDIYRAMAVTSLIEAHDPLYHFPDRPVRGMYDKEWHDTVEPHAIPLIFPIIELPCECSTNVTAAIGEDSCLTVSWDSLERQSRWVVSVEAPGVHIVDTADGCQWQRCAMDPGKRYSVRVRSRCDNLRSYSWSRWSNAVTTGAEVGIATGDREMGFSLSPNPAGESVTVTLVAPTDDCRLELYDAAGRRVETLAMPAAATSATLDLRHCAPGVYLLKLLSPTGNAAHTLVVR